MKRIIIHAKVAAGELVWTGIPGQYLRAPEAPGKLYDFVEYADRWNCHVRFAFEEVTI